jgi:simple sugar transport system substrate-binding protein
MKRSFGVVLMLLLALGVFAVVPAVAQDDDFKFAIILVGPKNDGGWSQAHYEGGAYADEHIEGVTLLPVYENLIPGDPANTLESIVQNYVDQGAKLILTTSDAFEEDTTNVAELPAFEGITFINVSGDDVYTGEAPANLGNVMGEMEWGKLLAGCAAGLTTQTGKIGYLGPLINWETRRLAASAYLGAKYCYETYAGGEPDTLEFTVTWIGFWFYNPAFNTLDPTVETNTFFDNGADVVMSGIDTTEVITVAAQRRAEGGEVWAVPYDFAGACDLGPDVCLGVPYFNWGPAYTEIVQAVKDGTYESAFTLVGPDWSDLDNVDTTGIGFAKGPALSEEDSASLDAFIADASAFAADEANANYIYLWQGPLSYQDGTEIAPDGELLPFIAPLGEAPSVWYLDQLLGGMIGASTT